MTVRYINLKETAKMVRALLKKQFPGTKFSVRGESYAGGASINVCYDYDAKGAPNSCDVQDAVQVFSGKGFDGMIDMAFYKKSIILADGTVIMGSNSGTTGSGGVYEPTVVEVPEGAEVVSFSSDYVMVSRTY